MRPVFRSSVSIRAACLLLGAASVLAGCRGGDDPVVVGAIGPWTRDYALSTRRGIELAAAEVNRTGGIGGRRVVVDFRDDGADASRAVRIAGEFAADRNVAAVIGPLNSGPLVAAARVVDGHLAAVAPTAASPELSGISPWVFRLISNDSVFGITLGRNALRLGRRAAVLYDNNAFGRGGADAFRRNFTGRIVSADPIWPGDPDVRAFLSFYRREGVDLVYVAGLTPSGLAVLREARRQGFGGAVLGTDSWTSLTAEPGSATDGVFIATRFSVLEQRPEVSAFNGAFRQRFRTEPDGFAAFGYDALRIVSRAMREVGPDRTAVRDWLAGLHRGPGYPGVTGRIRFSPAGEPEGSRFVLLQVKDGKLALADVQ